MSKMEGKYVGVYQALSEMREAFHSYGRLDDSNAKLDEVSKLFATYIAYKQGKIPTFPAGDEKELVARLQDSFKLASQLPQLCDQQGRSIFGNKPALALQADDEVLSRHLVQVTRSAIDAAFESMNGDEPLDVLNEAFGHFVRDNFRGNIEDAQYMTPAEVVGFMVEMALFDLSLEDENSSLIVLDPTCGVGSFLAAFSLAAARQGRDRARLRLFGQDKVERMVRLSTINMELFEARAHQIYCGNSLVLGGPLDPLKGKVDLILTNPPFGARISREQLVASVGSNAPFFGRHRSVPGIDSELLFIDRNIELLKPGGRLVIIVPDGVVSARGASALLRKYVAQTCTVEAIIALPPTTFAQAGTRTKTVILYLRKGKRDDAATFIGVANDLGFQVSSRKGVQIKRYEGVNELPSLLASYKKFRSNATSVPKVYSSSPSAVSVPEAEIISGSWTPGHYSAKRYQALSELAGNEDIELVPLADLAEFCADRSALELWSAGTVFISVLHVLGEGFIDISGARTHAPKTPGVLTEAGDVLVSKINPRIPRVVVTPNFGARTLCSSEFEVLRPKGRISPYALAYLLQSKLVQDQIQSLTSGTSASHNRIRGRELASVAIPLPKTGSRSESVFMSIVKTYEEATKSLVDASMKLSRIRAQEGASGGPWGRSK